MKHLFKDRQPVWATLARASLLNVALGLVGFVILAPLTMVGLFIDAYVFILLASLLVLTTDFSSKRFAAAAAIIFLVTLLASDSAYFFAATANDGTYPFDGRVIAGMTIGVAYAIACLVGVWATWRFSARRRTTLALVAIAIPVAFAVAAIMAFFWMGTICAVLRDCP